MDVSDHKRLSNTTLETQVKHCSSLHCSVTEWSSRLSFCFWLITEIKTRNHYYIYNSFMFTKFSNPVSCKMFYLLILKILYKEGRQCWQKKLCKEGRQCWQKKLCKEGRQCWPKRNYKEGRQCWQKKLYKEGRQCWQKKLKRRGNNVDQYIYIRRGDIFFS